MARKKILTNFAADKKALQKRTSAFRHSLDEVSRTINDLGKKKKR